MEIYIYVSSYNTYMPIPAFPMLRGSREWVDGMSYLILDKAIFYEQLVNRKEYIKIPHIRCGSYIF